MEKQSILEFIEGAPEIPRVLTARRTTESRHQFRLLVRALRRRLSAKPTYFTYEKGAPDRVKATIEEASVFDVGWRAETRLFVLEGFPKNWVESLHPPTTSYVVAETDEGFLQPTPYSLKRRRDVLKALTTILEHELGVKPEHELSLRALKQLEWGGLTRFEEYEALLRKAYLMEWNEERIGEELSARGRTNILEAMKRSDFKAIFGLIQRLSHQGVYNSLLSSLADLTYYRALKQLGFDEDRTQREMGCSDWRREELEEAARAFSADDLQNTAERVVRLDPLTTRYKALGVEIILLNASVRAQK